MHDPLVVAFEIRAPWLVRSGLPATGSRGDGVRWRIRLHHDCGPWCAGEPPHRTGAFPWWKPGSYGSFWRLAGRDYYWPPLITVWHREPGGRDSGEVCEHTRRVWDDANRRWLWKAQRRWRWHVHHWHIQVPPLQEARRWLLTRCAWCGGKSRKGDKVNFALSWHERRGHWWQGEPELFHHDCIDVHRAHHTCLCERPAGLNHMGYGTCSACGKFRPWAEGGYQPDEADRLLAAIPAGGRITPDIRPMVEEAWQLRKQRKQREDQDQP